MCYSFREWCSCMMTPWWLEFLIQTSWLHLRSLTARLPLKTGDWKAILSYWDSVTFQGLQSGKLTWQWNQDEFPIENGDTPPKFNIVPEKWWLEDYFPIGKVTSGGYSSNRYVIVKPRGYVKRFRASRSRLVSSRCIFSKRSDSLTGPLKKGLKY